MYRTAVWALGMGLLAGCDQVSERLGIPVAAKIEAEGNAVGGACRHAGRGLEDCYRLNPRADKPAIYAGWKEMNEYMLKNGMQSVPPMIPSTSSAGAPEATKASEAEARGGTGVEAGKPIAKMAAEGRPAGTTQGGSGPAH